MKDRAVRIMDVLANNKSIKSSMLAEMIDVSHVTLRKDLDSLEKHGIIRRAHGYISLDEDNNISKRLAFNYSIKRKIAAAAVQTIEDDETVMIESGSCCAIFAEELLLSKKNVTIITNSVFIANYTHHLPKVKIILLGGCFQPESQTLIGSMTTICAKHFYIDKFFLGTDGFNPQKGFTGNDYLCVETASDLTNHVKQVYMLTESNKFNHCGTYVMVEFDKITGVFTDDKIPKEAETSLIRNNVQLHKVSAVEEKIKWRKFPGQPPILYTDKGE
ncbi:MAG: DeoR/GlpR family DNA-binding transcription regulator [Treponema sp.]|nr:DeoR/GlpR family DNA-binding transcription regulator [Treponema sp.]